MSVWKKIPIPPAGVMPGGLVTKIGIAATSLLLAAMLLTYTFTGGGAQDAEIEVPEAADLGLQQRAQAAIEAEARRQAAQLRLQADAAERQLAQLQGEQESNAALLSAGIVPFQGQDPEAGLLPDDQPVPFGGQAPRTEAEAVLLETLRLEEMERRRRSLRTGPLVLSYRNTDPEAAASDALSGPLQAAQAVPQAALPGVTAENAVATAGDFLELLTELNDRELAATAQPALAAGGPAPAGVAPALALVQPETETPVAGLPSDPAGWDRIYEGSFLEAVLVTQLSGDFPGPVLANVSVPFYSADRQRVLIPRGARVVGSVRGRFRGRSGAAGRCLPPHHLARRPHRLTPIQWPQPDWGKRAQGRSQPTLLLDVCRGRRRRHPFRPDRDRLKPLCRRPTGLPGRSQSRAGGNCCADSRPLPQSPAHHHDSRGPPLANLVHRRCPRTAGTAADWGNPMTMKHAIAFSLTLTVVLAMPPRASAQFDLDLQATQIGTQLQEILNRVTQYTAQLTQFTRLDCSAQGMATGAEATPINEAAVVCDTLNMIGAFRDSYQQLLAVPTDLLNTPAPFPNWRDVLGAADTVTEADIRNVYPGSADRPVAVFQRRRDYADRSVVLAHARADASTALTDALDAAQAAVADLEARNSVTRTALAQTQVAAALTRARLLVALSNLRSHEAAAQAADAYNAEVARRQIESRRLADRAALEAQWAEEQATIAAAADQRIQSMYGGFQIPDGLGGN